MAHDLIGLIGLVGVCHLASLLERYRTRMLLRYVGSCLRWTAQPHMQQREWLAQPVLCGPTGDFESHAPVKAHGLLVLLVHVYLSGAQCPDGIGEQAASDSLATPVRMDK